MDIIEHVQSCYRVQFQLVLLRFYEVSTMRNTHCGLVCNDKELNANENGQEVEEREDQELALKKAAIRPECSKDAMMRVKLLIHITCLPLLENVSIMDSRKRGKVSLRYVMKGVKLYLVKWNDLSRKNDGSLMMNYDDVDVDDDFEDEQEAAYSEAMREILNKHKERLVRIE
ncbi:hypothetical protein Tco_0002999 [Tanacetum coccineum]